VSKQQTIVKTYKGNQEQATSAFRTDAEKMAIKGYFGVPDLFDVSQAQAAPVTC
jgi:hypothetical protein